MGKNKKKNNAKKVDNTDPEQLKVSPPNTRTVSSYLWQNLGNEEQMKGNFAEAIELYTRAIELKDDNAVYFSNRKFCPVSTNLTRRCPGVYRA